MADQKIIVTAAPRMRTSKPLDVTLDFVAKHPIIDVAATTIIIGGHWLIVHTYHWSDVFSWSGTTGETAVFAAGAGIISLIAGFAGVGITQYSSLTGEFTNRLRKSQGKSIRRNWLNITAWLLASSMLCVISLAIDTRSDGPAPWVFETALVISAFKFARLVILFRLILVAADFDSEDPPRTPAIKLRGG